MIFASYHESSEDCLSIFLSSLLILFVSWILWQFGRPWEVRLAATHILDCFREIRLHKCLTKVNWQENEKPSNTIVIQVEFFTQSGPRVIEPRDLALLSVRVVLNDHRILADVFLGNSDNNIQIIFSGRVIGIYKVTLYYSGNVVRGFPVCRETRPGEVDIKNTAFLDLQSHTLILTTSEFGPVLSLQPRDEFGNPIGADRLPALASRFSASLWKKMDSVNKRNELKLRNSANIVLFFHSSGEDYLRVLIFFFRQVGWYTAEIEFDGQKIADGDLVLIVLNPNDRAVVDRLCGTSEAVNRARTLKEKSGICFEAGLVGVNSKSLKGMKKVYANITAHEVTVREYFWQIFLCRTFSFRLVPSTKVDLVKHQLSNSSGNDDLMTILSLDDGMKGRLSLAMKNGDIFAACVHQMMLKQIGGSDTFARKQLVFYYRLICYHQSKSYHSRGLLELTVERRCLVESSFRATKRFSEADWCKLFQITFKSELGIDQGGLRREWFELLCKQLFHPSMGLFMPLEEGCDAVIPNPYPPKGYNKKYYEFAGLLVGKCLLESAHGSTYRQHFPVSLAKSFLAQLVGLRVNYKHFKQDAPDYFASKIHFIESSSVEEEGNGLDGLNFTEEELGPDGKVRVVELKPRGSKIRVREKNKMEYLDLLAQYKLRLCIKEQTELFVIGLRHLVPDNLLSLFNEAELELLLCGVREYDLNQLKIHHKVIYGDVHGNDLSERTIEWFWLTLANFTSDQMARLLQFTTGSSLLPLGGFAELKPIFQVAGSVKPNNLPTAHTCFNMICLSEHGSFLQFEKALLTAITEGNEGFGLL